MPVRIGIDANAPAGWDAYVEAHPFATAYHRSRAVAIARDAFGLRTRYLTAYDGDAVVGVLPLVEQSSFLFGRFLVSLPFFTYGGLLSNGDDIGVSLAHAAGELGRERRASHVEMRHVDAIASLDLPLRQDKVSMVLPLPADVDELGRRLGSKLRSQIRRAEREKPEVVWGGRELIPEFYRVYSGTMRDVGTPVYPRSFFDVVWRALEGSIATLVVRMRGVAQAAAIIVRHGNAIEVPWAGASRAAKSAALNMRMYWELLAHAVRAGAEAFDFGRSTAGSGTYRFKQQWGAAPRQLYWHYWLREGGRIPTLNHSNPKYDLVVAAWRRMPLWCANLLGPQIARHLP